MIVGWHRSFGNKIFLLSGEVVSMSISVHLIHRSTKVKCMWYHIHALIIMTFELKHQLKVWHQSCWTLLYLCADPRLTDYDTLLQNLGDLKEGKPVQVPIYDFKSSTRTGYRLNFEPSWLTVQFGIFWCLEKLFRDIDQRTMSMKNRKYVYLGNNFQSMAICVYENILYQLLYKLSVVSCVFPLCYSQLGSSISSNYKCYICCTC